MKYLITGIAGFVAGHYIEYLFKQDPQTQISGIDLSQPDFSFLEPSIRKTIKVYKDSLLDKKRVQDIISEVSPDYIIHLASQSSVAYSWKNPDESFSNNKNIFLNLVEGVRKTALNLRILSVGSAEVYGPAKDNNTPLSEDTPLNPVSPYAAARVAQEEIAKKYVSDFGLQIVSTRSFNHIGPRQTDTFVVSSLAKQVIEAKKGKRSKIVCGDLEVVRDFIDVRDIVRAYDLLVQKGKPGEIYNVGSGRAYKLREVLDMLFQRVGIKVPVEVNPGLIRPIENKVMVSLCQRLEKTTGFKARYSISDSLSDILTYWGNQI
ncbi:GDP-mannose 4,6-dehydratase [Candidatus Omnitrophota bacterium]